MIEIIVAIVIVGVFVYLIDTFAPLPPPFKKAIYVVCSLGLLLYILQAFGFISGFTLHGSAGNVRVR